MRERAAGPLWASLAVWIAVNSVNLLQTAGFLSRLYTGDMAMNHALGYGIMALAVPVAAALVGFVRARAGWLAWAGPALFLAFVGLMVAVDYASPVPFRSPARPAILIPYLGLFFGSILLMGLPMFSIARRLWAGTVATSVLLLGSMIVCVCAEGA